MKEKSHTTKEKISAIGMFIAIVAITLIIVIICYAVGIDLSKIGAH